MGKAPIAVLLRPHPTSTMESHVVALLRIAPMLPVEPRMTLGALDRHQLIWVK